jgi:AraC-like DNA-binding protein
VVGLLAFLFASHELLGTSDVVFGVQMRSQFVLDGLAVFWAYWCVIKTWAIDLDPYRRTARIYFVLGCGPVVLVVITLYLASLYLDPTFAYLVDLFVSGAIIIFGLMAVAFFTEVNNGLFGVKRGARTANVSASDSANAPGLLHSGAEKSLVTVQIDSVSDGLRESLEKIMVGQSRFQEMGLTLSSLAKYTSLPEYRLRSVINSDLGYRNFNAYLNHYRIAHAKTVLEDKWCDKSILDISMDCGYKSLSTFNKAFKDITSLTPSEYRKKR